MAVAVKKKVERNTTSLDSSLASTDINNQKQSGFNPLFSMIFCETEIINLELQACIFVSTQNGKQKKKNKTKSD